MTTALGDRPAIDNLASTGARPLAIEARGLVKRFDGTLAVDGVDISVPQGAIYGVLGPNGAGKTTTLRMLLGIIDPDAGVRKVLGHEDPHDVARLIVLHLLDHARGERGVRRERSGDLRREDEHRHPRLLSRNSLAAPKWLAM